MPRGCVLVGGGGDERGSYAAFRFMMMMRHDTNEMTCICVCIYICRLGWGQS